MPEQPYSITRVKPLSCWSIVDPAPLALFVALRQHICSASESKAVFSTSKKQTFLVTLDFLKGADSDSDSHPALEEHIRTAVQLCRPLRERWPTIPSNLPVQFTVPQFPDAANSRDPNDEEGHLSHVSHLSQSHLTLMMSLGLMMSLPPSRPSSPEGRASASATTDKKHWNPRQKRSRQILAHKREPQHSSAHSEC